MSAAAGLPAPEPVELAATAALEGFAPIGLRVRLRGHRCPACGLEQAPPGAFDVGRGGRRSSDVGKALDAAVASLGLPL